MAVRRSFNRILLFATLCSALSLVAIFARPVPPPAPSNDNYANAAVISSTPYSNTQDVTLATTEPDDPIPVDDTNPMIPCADNMAVRTVWYKFVSPANGTIVADTFNSTYDTILSAYLLNPNNNHLDQLKCNDDWVGLTSQVTFPTTSGMTYYMLVSQFNTDTSPVRTLNFHANFYSGIPSNDNFASAKVITHLPFSDSVPDFEATTEVTDPEPSCSAPPQKTLWYRYTPSSNVTIAVDTINSTYDTALVVYTGSTGSFVQVACSDNDAAGGQESLSFMATSGTTYSFMISAFQGAGGILNFHVDTIPSSKRRAGQITSQ